MTITSQKIKSRHNTVQGACLIPSSGSHVPGRSIHFKSKRCSKCKQIKPISEFYKDHTKRSGYRPDCKCCHLKQSKDYYQTEQGKNIRKINDKNFRIRHPEQHKAGDTVKIAIRAGKLPRPDTLFCMYCYEMAQHYHHPDYSKPLEVIPICRKCHSKIHLAYDAKALELFGEFANTNF